MEIIAVFGPLVAAVIAGFLRTSLGGKGAAFVTCAAVIAAALASAIIFTHVCLEQSPRTLELFTWISSGAFQVKWALRFDQLAAVMVLVVNLVSACVHVYSVGYMSHDPCKARFMAYLSFFTFAMLMLVTADNFLQLFFGWEGVGVASYLLIGFWNQKDSANAAAIKAFVVNRVGDFGLALGIMAVFLVFGSVTFDSVFAAAPTMQEVTLTFLGKTVGALDIICLLLFIGAMGKSAQLGLHTWLPDAMEGPTPVSALIHAATMVTAGVFLLCRLSPLYEYAPSILTLITVIGALTAFVAATIGMTQFDIKRVIAYSTMSQLGYMFFAVGVSAYGVAMFHLFTHAFFKALLFLGAGSVIHAMSDEQDMRKMGGIKDKVKQTYWLMVIGSVALAGLPPLSGYFSKDLILEAAYGAHTGVGVFAFWMGVAAAFMTAFYSWRLLFLSFHGKPRANKKTMDHVHESPPVMLIPLYILAAGAVFSGIVFAGYFVGDARTVFWGQTLFTRAEPDAVELAHHVASWVKLLPVAVAAFGIALAWVMYIRNPALPARFAAIFSKVHALLFNKWYFDELYNLLFVKTAFRLARGLWKRGDVKLIDGYGPNGVAGAVLKASVRSSRMQTGYVYHYAFAMLAGLVGFVSWYLYLVLGG